MTADGSGILACRYPRPALPSHPWSDRYRMGEFCWRDDFMGAQLRPEWNSIGRSMTRYFSTSSLIRI
jgi:hypothetical protein